MHSLENSNQTADSWNKLAILYQEKFMDLELYNGSYDLFCGLIKSQHAKILDIGCGPGNITRYILKKYPEFLIEGIDIAPAMVALAIENNPQASFRVMDSRQINTIRTSYDGIISGFCLPYLNGVECEKLITDAYNLLNDEGILYLSFVDGDPLLSGFKSGSSGQRIFFNYHHREDIIRCMKKAGFRQPDEVHLNYTTTQGETEIHCILLASKAGNNNL